VVEAFVQEGFDKPKGRVIVEIVDQFDISAECFWNLRI